MFTIYENISETGSRTYTTVVRIVVVIVPTHIDFTSGSQGLGLIDLVSRKIILGVY